MPFEKGWKPQRPGLAPVLALRGAADAALGRFRRTGGGALARDFQRDWFEAGMNKHRELVASVPDSPLWEFADRDRLIARLTLPAAERRGDTESLAAVMTALWYFHGPRAGLS
jgi:hypothetical protein